MNYQVWTNKEYEGWTKVDCGDMPAAELAILEAIKQGQEPLLTVAIPYKFNVKVEENKAGEDISSKSKKPLTIVKVPEEVEVEAPKD